MTITSTNRSTIGYIEEVTKGITPAAPNFQIIPTTGGSPKSETKTEVSEVIRDDRMTDDLIPVDEDISGEIEFELSYAPYKPLITSLLRTAPIIVTISDTDISAANADNSFNQSAGSFVTSNVTAGMFILVGGFADPANNGVFRVVTVTALKIVVTGGTLVTEGAGPTITMDGIHVVNGESNIDSYSFIKRILGITSPAYFYYRGMQISKMDFSIEVGSKITGTMTLMGLTEEITETEIPSSGYINSPVYTILNAVSSVSQISLTGITDVVNYNSLNFSIDNKIEAAKAIGTLGAVDLAAFTLDVMGDINIYFESKDIYDAYKGATAFVIDLVLQDTSGHYIGIHFPNCKFETLETPIDGKDNFFMAKGTFRALRDTTLNKMISFTFME